MVKENKPILVSDIVFYAAICLVHILPHCPKQMFKEKTERVWNNRATSLEVMGQTCLGNSVSMLCTFLYNYR